VLDNHRRPWSNCPDRGALTFLTQFLFGSALALDRTATWESPIDKDHFSVAFWRTPDIQRMLSQPSLEALYLAIAQLPYDGTFSVQSLYDCLHYCCQMTAPDLCWMLEYLSTGCLLVNSTARRMHTYAVKLVLYNFGMLIAHRAISDSTAPLPEFDHWNSGRDLSS